MQKLTLYLLTALILVSVSCSEKDTLITSEGIILYPRSKPEQSVRLQVISDRIIRVTAIPERYFPGTESLMAVKGPSPDTDFMVEENDTATVLSTARLKAYVSNLTGEVWFTDTAGIMLLEEKKGGGKSYEEVKLKGEKYYAVQQQFESPDNEALYGLGCNQTSFMNLKGKDADLYQYNTLTAVPFLLSSRNYGILWDNYSRSKFGDKREYEDISSMKLYNSEGQAGGLTASYYYSKDREEVFTRREEKEINYRFIPDLAGLPGGYDLAEGYITWEGFVEPAVGGQHKFIFTSAGYARLYIDNRLIFDRWRVAWNASSNYFDLPMEEGEKYSIRIEWVPDGGESYMALKHLDPLPVDEQNRISLYSEVASQIDYYFISGSDMDDVISGYRSVTGKAPVMPRWAMGFWQSRERYTSQEELLSVVREFRKRNIPLDNIVQDWQYWPVDSWGDHEFDPERFPDPEGMIQTLHDSLNTKIMISVWPKYYVGTDNYKVMNNKGWLYKRNVEKGQKDWLGYVSTFYDAFNAEARQAFWQQINESLFSKGIDAWWLDATEPDINSNLPMDERIALMDTTALGPAAEYFNAFSLVNAKAVYEGQRRTDPDKRVFILTRSAYAGIQRYSAANWSGDIAARWHDMEAQIPGGLNFCMSGIPWWTMDIGGFAVESRYYNPSPEDLEEWRELMTRWFQYGTFCPIFRSHGQYPYREIFNVAPESHQAYQSMLAYDKLRYRLMPYIYSLAGHTWLNDYTLMRGLAMDFTADSKVYDIKDQYMFGPALLVNPVYKYKERSRKVYLPASCGWYDFHTGMYLRGGQLINAPAPYDKIPLYIKEGSIIPLGPEIQYSTEKPANPISLFVYAGADGQFVLYEDGNTNYDYEEGAYSLIRFDYDDNDKILTIGQREGEFPGMLKERTFRIFLGSEENQLATDPEQEPHARLKYDGSALKIKL